MPEAVSETCGDDVHTVARRRVRAAAAAAGGADVALRPADAAAAQPAAALPRSRALLVRFAASGPHPPAKPVDEGLKSFSPYVPRRRTLHPDVINTC